MTVAFFFTLPLGCLGLICFSVRRWAHDQSIAGKL